MEAYRFYHLLVLKGVSHWNRGCCSGASREPLDPLAGAMYLTTTVSQRRMAS